MEFQPFPKNDPDPDKAQYIAALITGYLRQSLTPFEHNALDNWVQESDNNMRLFEQLTDTYELQEGVSWVKQTRSGKMLRKLKKQLRFNRPRFRIRILQYSL